MSYFDTVDKLFCGVFFALILLCVVGTAVLLSALTDTIKDIRWKNKVRSALWQRYSNTGDASELLAALPDEQSYWRQQPPSTS